MLSPTTSIFKPTLWFLQKTLIARHIIPTWEPDGGEGELKRPSFLSPSFSPAGRRKVPNRDGLPEGGTTLKDASQALPSQTHLVGNRSGRHILESFRLFLGQTYLSQWPVVVPKSLSSIPLLMKSLNPGASLQS